MMSEGAWTGGFLSKEQAAYLIEAGEFTPEELADTQARIARGELAEEERQTRQEAIEDSLGAAEVAAWLGLDQGQVEGRRADGSLFAFFTNGELRYPTWQFTLDRQQPLIPGVRELVRAIPADWHPAGVRSFMKTPQRSARIAGVPATPVDWLMAGGDVQVLVNVLDSFLQS